MIKNTDKELKMKNPVVIAPGPWSRGYDRLKKALASGAGVVITETIVSESYPDLCPRYASVPGGGVQNIRVYSGLELENWVSDLNRIDEQERFGSETKLIASIMGTSASELCYIAKKVEKTGVDGVEIGFACPMGEGPELICGDPDKVYEYTKAVVEAIDIPVSVKANISIGSIPAFVQAAEAGGAQAVSAIDTIRGILGVDIETGKPLLPTYGGYSGAPVKPAALAAVGGIAQVTDIPVIGIGGIKNYTDVIEFMMMGASAAGVGTEILLRGYGVINEITDGLNKWTEEKELDSIWDIRGKALKELKSFEEIKAEKKKAVFTSDCISHCDACERACFTEAISVENGRYTVCDEKCDGCGLCVSICPEKCIILRR